MIEWNEMQLQVRDMVRRFVEAEVKPHLDEIEHGDTPPYAILRKLVATFGLADMARARFAKEIEPPFEKLNDGSKKPPKEYSEERGMAVAMQLIPIIELCRYSPGLVTAMGVSMGLTSAAILSRGTRRQIDGLHVDVMELDRHVEIFVLGEFDQHAFGKNRGELAGVGRVF